ncbi:MAG: MarR family transcriptional regulator [Lysobacterales bacterium]
MYSATPAMQLVMDFSRLQAKILKRVDSGLSIHGISFTEYLVMCQLSRAPANTMRRIDLAESIGLSASGITRLLIPMEKIGLVKKEENPRDARVSLVRLSNAGAQMFKDASVSFGHSADLIMQAIDDKQLEQLARITEKLL